MEAAAEMRVVPRHVGQGGESSGEELRKQAQTEFRMWACVSAESTSSRGTLSLQIPFWS